MKIYVGVTDNEWFKYLDNLQPDEVNFWQPGGKQAFRVLRPNELFLFKLHSPLNYIVGGGFFVRHSFLPLSLAWKAFENKNGTKDFITFQNLIYKHRNTNRIEEPDPVIGCIILSAPFFFKEYDWINVSNDWKPNIVQGKSFDTDTIEGRNLYKQVQQKLSHSMNLSKYPAVLEYSTENRYGVEQIIQPRLGQGAFRVIVTEVYNRKCAITGERTLPVLEAAHIRPYTQDGPHAANNGLLLREDLHTLFDRGYLTITDDFRIEVSKRIKSDYGNGREYYAYHGKSLAQIPEKVDDRPSVDFLRWHNEKIYLA